MPSHPGTHSPFLPIARTEPAAPLRAPYTAPRLESLGRWRALTLQQSIPIGPGGFLLGSTPSAQWD